MENNKICIPLKNVNRTLSTYIRNGNDIYNCIGFDKDGNCCYQYYGTARNRKKKRTIGIIGTGNSGQTIPNTGNSQTLLNGSSGVNYSNQLTALINGNQVGATFSVTLGSLPAGIILSSAGLISGTYIPTGGIVVTFTVTATYGGSTGTQVFVLTIIGTS